MVNASVGFSKKIAIALFKNPDTLTTSCTYREFVLFFQYCSANVLLPLFHASTMDISGLWLMLPCLDYRVEMSLTRVNALERY